MASLTTQNVHAGGAITTQAASAGGDSMAGGTSAGGWGSSAFLYAIIGATETTITVAHSINTGVAYGPYSDETVMLPVNNIYAGTTGYVTYNQVVGVEVAAVRTGPALG